MKIPNKILFIIIYSVSFFNIFASNNGEDKTSKNSGNIGFDNASIRIIENDNHFELIPGELGKFIPISGDIDQLKYFFDSLKGSKNKKVRIVHFGDSQIQGDNISSFIREKLQQKYGGKGTGFLSIQSNDIKMRFTTDHTFSNDWNFASVITRNPDNFPLGLSGSVAIPKPGSWVKYQSVNYLKSSSSFEIARLFYSNADESSAIQYKINNGKTVKVFLKKGEGIQELRIDTKLSATSIEITFITGKQPYFYGVSLESNYGIYVDNIPMPGNTGASLLDIPLSNLSDFYKLSNYSLIILSYGNNVSSSNRGIFTVYENKMRNVIEHLRKAFPNTSILMFSVNDKTIKQGNRFITNPDVPILLETQKKIVDKMNVAFWNLWEAMGGNNSMNEWVNAAPPMALKDFAHFTQKGGERIAELFINSLLDTGAKISK